MSLLAWTKPVRLTRPHRRRQSISIWLPTQAWAALNEVRTRFGERIASVVHMAAYYDISGDPNPLYDKITVKGTRRLIDALQEFEVEQFILASTMLVHKPTDRPDVTVDEESPIEPTWAYPLCVLGSVCRLKYRRHLNWNIFREEMTVEATTS